MTRVSDLCGRAARHTEIGEAFEVSQYPKEIGFNQAIAARYRSLSMERPILTEKNSRRSRKDVTEKKCLNLGY
jgi:hypothetical protein